MSPRKNYSQMYKEENDTRDKKDFENGVLDKVEEDKKEERVLDDVKEENVMEKVKKVKKEKKKEGVVVGGTLNVRANPNGTIVGVLQDGDVIEILAEEGEWYKIENGFVMAKFIEVK